MTTAARLTGLLQKVVLEFLALRKNTLLETLQLIPLYDPGEKGRTPKRKCRRGTFVRSWKNTRGGISPQRISLIIVKNQTNLSSFKVLFRCNYVYCCFMFIH